MNALADDQLGRLRKLLATLQRSLSADTPVTPRDRQGCGAPLRSCCQRKVHAARDQGGPPHILLTNFAMLEYLLLRPRDSEVFSSNRLQFIVLDEAHTYSGAKGIEIALLMRRLREYLIGSKQQIQFVLTSATMGDEDSAIPR